MFPQWWTYCGGQKRLKIQKDPGISLEQEIHNPKDIIAPEPLINLITKVIRSHQVTICLTFIPVH